MNPTEHHFQVAKTARYYTLGPDIEEAKHILIRPNSQYRFQSQSRLLV